MHFLDKISQQNVEKKHLLRNNTTNPLLCVVYGHYFFQSELPLNLLVTWVILRNRRLHNPRNAFLLGKYCLSFGHFADRCSWGDFVYEFPTWTPKHLLPNLHPFCRLVLHQFACKSVAGDGRPMDRHKSPAAPSQTHRSFPSGRVSRVVVGLGVGRIDESLLVGQIPAPILFCPAGSHEVDNFFLPGSGGHYNFRPSESLHKDPRVLSIWGASTTINCAQFIRETATTCGCCFPIRRTTGGSRTNILSICRKKSFPDWNLKPAWLFVTEWRRFVYWLFRWLLFSWTSLFLLFKQTRATFYYAYPIFCNPLLWSNSQQNPRFCQKISIDVVSSVPSTKQSNKNERSPAAYGRYRQMG